MSDKCPLCGNRRLQDSLFCIDCTKKVQSDYEVMLPESVDLKINNTTNIHDDEIVTESTKEFPGEGNVADSSNDIPFDNKSLTEELVEEKIYVKSENYSDKRYKKRKKLIRIVFVILILVGSYFVFYEVVLEKNLERSAWETAVKQNSVDGYLSYIEKHPSGIHFDEAQEGLMNLKRTEASVWKSLKESESISEMKGFITQYTNSPYLPLVEARLDSLSWIVALNTNSAESYYEYLEFSRHGDLKGDYVGEVQKRYDLLYQDTPIEDFELDSIRTTVSGFYSALSSLDHNGLYRFLAPHVNRFFDSGGASRERITGELLMTAAQTDNMRISFAPVLDGVKYKNAGNGFYEANVPLVKSYNDGNRDVLIPGYIAHISLNSAFEINSIYETKPYSDAP